MWLRFFSHWRRILAILGGICLLAAIGFAGWFIRALMASEDKVGEIQFRNDRSLVLHKTSPDGVPYTINYAEATFHLDVAPTDKNCERLFPDYAAALKFARDAGLPSMPSVQMIHGKCKQFDDDLCATLEQLAQNGSDHIPGKAPMLKRLVQKLINERNAATVQTRPAIEKAILHVATAMALGGGKAMLDPALAAEVEKRKAAFLENPAVAAPIGFWTENETLRQTFTQDRYLMQGIAPDRDAAVCIVLARVISDDPELARAFDFFREFDSRLTNPPVSVRQDVPSEAPARSLSFRDIASVLPQGVPLPDLLAPEQVGQTRAKLADSFGSDAGFALINYAGSPEYGLLLKAASEGKLDGRTASLELIIDAIQRGKLSLRPAPGSGWYDYQWYALETLLLPERAEESAKLTLSDAYKRRLEEAFKSSIAKNRETHIKQLPEIMLGMSMRGAAPPLEIHPDFSAEPTITVYLRTARAYRFLHTALTAVLGVETLHAPRKTSSANSGNRSLGDELNRMVLLCYGIHHIVSLELGLKPSYLPDEISPAELEEAEQIASQWLANTAADPDLAHDTRIAAPIMTDANGAVKYWATAGIHLQRVKYEFKREPSVGNEITAVFVPGYYYLPTDVSLEFQKSAGLTRTEFQRMCDSCADEASLRRLLDAPDHAARQRLSHAIWSGTILVLAGIMLFLAWKTGLAPSKRVIRSALAVAALLFAGWIAVMCFDKGYCTKFIIRQIASRNSTLAMIYRDRYFSHYRTEGHVSPAVLRGLVDLLRDTDRQTRFIAVSYLNALGAENLSTISGAEENLRGIAEDPDPVLAEEAFYLLGMFHDDRNIEFLRTKLKDGATDENERVAALNGLARTADPRGIEDIIACTRQSNASLRNAAIYMLGSYDDQRCLDIIAELLPSTELNSSRSALRALERSHYADPGRDISGRVDPALLAAVCNATFPPNHRRNLSSMIRDVPTRVLAYENMLSFPGSQSSKSTATLQAAAVSELMNLNSAAARAIPAMEKTLQDPELDPQLRKQIQRAIKSINPSFQTNTEGNGD